MYKKLFKRIIDFVVAFIVIIVSSPILLLIAIAIKIDSKGPIVFKQRRLGKNGKEYDMYKFRTMVVDAEAGGVYSDNNDPRITKVGSFLRHTSLDELLQCINVIKGDMSLVGFRPPLTYHPWSFDKYTDDQKRMFDVLPGITGWAQVNGRKAVEWSKRIELNIWYTEHISLWLDLKIIWLTVWKVLSNADNENLGATVKKSEKHTEESEDK